MTSKRISKVDPRNAVMRPHLGVQLDDRKSPEDILPYFPQQFSTPALDESGKRVFVGTEFGGFYCLDANTGVKIWHFNPPAGSWSSEALVKDGIVYTGNNEGLMYALTAAEGKPLWSYQSEGAIRSKPLFMDGKIIFLNTAGRLIALAAENGEWRWHAGEKKYSGMAIKTFTGPAELGQHAVLTAFLDGSVGSLNSLDGSTIWRKKIGRAADFRDIGGEIALTPHGIVVPVYNGGVFWLNPKDGEILREKEDIDFPSALAWDGKSKIAVTTGDSRIIMLESSTGRKLWSYNFKKGFIRKPVFYKNYLIAPHSSLGLFFLHAEDATAIQGIRFAQGAMGAPYVRGDTMFILTNAGFLYGMRGDLLPVAAGGDRR